MGARHHLRPRAGDRQAGARGRAHPRLPPARPPGRRQRPAHLPPAPPPRPGHHLLRAEPVGPGPLLPHPGPGRARPGHPARDPQDAARRLLPHRGRGVHAHPGPGPARLVAGAPRARLGGHRRRGAPSDPHQAGAGRGLRDLPADQVRGPEALQPRGRGVPHRGPGPPARRRCPRRPRRGRHRHGPPRPPQRAHQHRRQVLRPGLRRVRGQRRHRGSRNRGRQVPPGHRGRLLRDRRRLHPRLPGRQPLPPGDGRRRRRGHRARQAGPHRPGREGLHGHAGPRPRRRGLRRPGRGLRDPQHEPAARLPHRRHRPHRRQQPDRLHHRLGLGPLHHLRHRPGQGPAGADLPRQR